jgi:transcriptional regulator with XRE-family HTH domain
MSSEKEIAVFVRHIEQLRKALDLTKGEFAGKLGISRVAILHWENGRSWPSPEKFFLLARLAKDKAPSLTLYFLEQAGVDEAVLRSVIPDFDRGFKAFERRLKEWSEKDQAGSVPLPLIEDIGQGSHVNVISRIRSAIREGVETYVPFPKTFVPLPQATVCLRAPDDYMRPIFHAGDLLAVDISCEGEPTPEHAQEFAQRITEQLLLPLGDRAIFAVYYNRPPEPRLRVRGGLHARGVTFTVDDEGKPEGHIHFTTEMGLNVIAASQALGGKPKSFTDLEETLDLIIPVDPGISVIGRVTAWVGSAWDPKREPTRKYNLHSLIDHIRIIGGHLNTFALGTEANKPQRGRGPKK